MIKLYTELPRVNDVVLFPLLTPNAQDCFTENPYAFVNITIYYIQRDFANPNLSEFDDVSSQKGLETEYYRLNNIACINPTPENLQRAADAKSRLLTSQIESNNYYLNSVVVFNKGSESEPLWKSDNSIQFPIVKPAPNESFAYGRFMFEWTAENVREGDYFICYKYKPNLNGDTISAHQKFYLESDIKGTTSLPSHRTPPKKYFDLLTKYLPEMYKQKYAANDIGPNVLEKTNKSIGDGFTMLENLSNQIIDLYDANVIQDQLLIYLANMFNTPLRSTDPTRWRKQVAKSIPLNKKKGTLKGLREVLDDAGIRLLSYSQLWLVGSEFVFTESFAYEGETRWTLDKVSLPINVQHFKLEFENNTQAYQEINLSNCEIITFAGKSVLVWKGKELQAGDRIKLTYQIKEFANETQIQISNYILSLQLADTRDDRTFEFPKKDWNTHVIEENDPLFSTIINVKNPFYDPIKFGKIRTEFPYSEQAYNMDEYNGSLRDSYEPKDIDKNFVEPCRNTISSYYNVDLLIQDLSNTRLIEAQEILEQFMPFHAILHTLKFVGYFDDIIVPPVESIQILIKYEGDEFTISGQANSSFNRNMVLPFYTNQVLRNVLASSSTEDTGSTTGYNEEVRLFAPLYNLSSIGLDNSPSNNMLEVLAPHINAGEYGITDPITNTAKVAIGSIPELLNTSDFTFRLSNIIFASANFNIFQDNIHYLSDTTQHFVMYPIKTLWDVIYGYSNSCWKVYITSLSKYYNIYNIDDNSLILEDDGTLYNNDIQNLEYNLVDNNNNLIFSSTTGNYYIKHRGRVEIPISLGIQDVSQYITENNYFYLDSTSQQYDVVGWNESNKLQFYISNWNSGDLALVAGKFLKRLIKEATGNFNYSEIKILKPITWPTFTSPNDPNALEDSNFTENYLVEHNSTKYAIVKEQTVGPNTYVYLTGKFVSLGTQTYGGSTFSYILYRYIKNPINIMGDEYNFIDRSGQELIQGQINNMSLYVASRLLEKEETRENLKNGQPQDFSQQFEGISYSIKRKDGTESKGEL